ncbi:uncharacterized protein B0H18DRAFT_1064903 [Fomitopsis serialis]|uniref:uncharacterized protein n=1 Tax=Fomitopsis serialis TaxID=139415 RepID=UPI0020075664|nr:uncharacterized protein B0H18DRAFT_1064903 [Neoantrodia serialis]KAH9911043.1 hypothetical protein B0H18DRAFT_1064903 [Neoantrodia serialis]
MQCALRSLLRTTLTLTVLASTTLHFSSRKILKSVLRLARQCFPRLLWQPRLNTMLAEPGQTHTGSMSLRRLAQSSFLRSTTQQRI